MPTAFCASQWPCGSVLLGDFGIGGMLIGEVEAIIQPHTKANAPLRLERMMLPDHSL